MHTEQILVTLLAAAQVASGAALSKAFTLAQEESPNLKFRDAYIETEETYEKFRAPVPDHIRVAAAKQKGSVAAKPENFDKAYISPVFIGTPAKKLQLDFDTGSSDLWVFSNQQPKGQRKGHAIYNPSASNTSTLLDGESWNIKYGDGSGASGVVYSDKVVIGGVTATAQAVEAATSVSKSFVKNRVQDGLVGLAFSSINTVKPDQQTTFWKTVQSTLAKPVFAALLKKGAAGKYDFGLIDNSVYKGSINYVPIDNSQGFWSFKANGYAVGGVTTTDPFTTIADTGTSLAYVPSQVASNYYGQVNGAVKQQGIYIFPCNQASSLPSFSVVLKGKKQTIPGSYINYAPLGQGYCFGGIQENTGLPFSILGDVFLKSQYAVFDFGATQIGFANQK